MLEKNLSWCALLPNFKKNQKTKLVSSQIRLVHLPHLRGQLWDVTTSEIHSFSRSLTCRAAPLGYNNVSLGWVYSRVSLSVWPLAVVRLAFTNKILLTGREMLPCFCWLLFQWPTAVKQAKFATAKKFYCCAYAKLVCYAIARFLAARWKFVCKTRLYPIFPKHFVLFVWFYLEGLLYSQKTNLQKIFDRVFSSFMYTFYSQFSTRTDWKSVAKRAGCSKHPLFFALTISFIQWGINETITKLSWKFEENRTSRRFYFFKQKRT